MAFQRITIKGNIGGDINVRHSQSGSAVANFSVAVGEKWRDKASGQDKEHTEWFRCVAFGATGENIRKFFSKGSGILIDGKIRTDKYQDKITGEDKVSVQLIVGQFDFVDKRDSNQQQAPQQSAPAQAPVGGSTDFDESIPF